MLKGTMACERSTPKIDSAARKLRKTTSKRSYLCTPELTTKTGETKIHHNDKTMWLPTLRHLSRARMANAQTMDTRWMNNLMKNLSHQ